MKTLSTMRFLIVFNASGVHLSSKLGRHSFPVNSFISKAFFPSTCCIFVFTIATIVARNSRQQYPFMHDYNSTLNTLSSIACEQLPGKGGKKIRRKRDSVSEASGSRSVNPRAKRGGSTVTLSSPDSSRLDPLTLDYTRLARSKTNREPVRRLSLR